MANFTTNGMSVSFTECDGWYYGEIDGELIVKSDEIDFAIQELLNEVGRRCENAQRSQVSESKT